LGFPPGFTPGWAGPSRACRSGDEPSGTGPELRHRHQRPPSTHSLTTSDLMSQCTFEVLLELVWIRASALLSSQFRSTFTVDPPSAQHLDEKPGLVQPLRAETLAGNAATIAAVTGQGSYRKATCAVRPGSTAIRRRGRCSGGRCCHCPALPRAGGRPVTIREAPTSGGVVAAADSARAPTGAKGTVSACAALAGPGRGQRWPQARHYGYVRHV
jgi:hypothetical protein